MKSPRFIPLAGAAVLAAGVLMPTMMGQVLSDGTVLRVESTQRVKAGKDTLIYHRVAAPVAAPRAAAPAVGNAKPLGFDAAEAKRRQVFLSLTAYIYDGITELVWMEEGEVVHRALSNVDFSVFPVNFDFRTEATHYAATIMAFNFGGVPAGDMSRTANHATALTTLRRKGNSDFVLLAATDKVASAEATELLDVMHAYYAVNKESLKLAATQRLAETEEQVRKQEEEASKPRTITINYWREEATPLSP